MNSPRPRGQAVSRRDSQDLQRVARLRAGVAKADLRQRSAELIAFGESQLARIYSRHDELWAEAVSAAEREVEKADQHLAEVCHQMGIPEEFRPSVQLSWWGRGATLSAERRKEHRQVLAAEIRAAEARALLEVERQTVAIITELITGQLSGEAARAVLDGMPTVEDLLPAMDVRQIPGIASDLPTVPLASSPEVLE